MNDNAPVPTFVRIIASIFALGIGLCFIDPLINAYQSYLFLGIGLTCMGGAIIAFLLFMIWMNDE